MIREFKNIPIQEIDDRDRTYAISAIPKNFDALAASIRREGLMNPIIVQKRRDSRYRIVNGFRRWAALKAIERPQIPALVVDDGFSDLEIFEKVINDRVYSRPLNPIELSTVIHKLEVQFSVPRSEIIQRYFPLMGYGRNPRVYELYAKLVELNAEWQDALAQELVSIDIASAMIDLPDAICNAFLNLIKDLRLGKNQQRAFWALLSDVARIREMEIPAVLELPALKTILSDEKVTPSQKTERLKTELYRLRYPRYSRMQKAFDMLIREARLPQGMSIKAPAYFEGEDFYVSFSFSSEEDFERRISFLKLLLQKRMIRKMIELNS